MALPSTTVSPPSSAILAEVTLAVLAGGEGSRMGQAKANLSVHGQPILRHLLRCLNWPGQTLLVTAPGREHPPAWEDFEREVTDAVAGQGPLRGILTALDAAQTHLVIVTTVDMPGIACSQLQWLIQRLMERPECSGVIYSRQTATGPQIEPFPAALRRGLRRQAKAAITAGEGGVQQFLRRSGVATLPVPADWPDSLWVNLNYPSDLEAYTKQKAAS